MPPIAVVFDTNILASGTGWQGNPYRCLQCARVSLVEGVTCEEILEELVEKLQAKLHFSDSQATDTIADLLTFLRLVTLTNTLKVIPADPDDDKVLECAVIGNAAYIVTGDRRHLLPLRNYQGVAIVSATEFLALVSPSG